MRRRSILILITTTIALSILVYMKAGMIWSVLVTIAQLVIGPLIIEVLAGKLEKEIPDNPFKAPSFIFNPRNAISWWALRRHINDQVNNMRRMPFVSKDMLGIDDLLDNFIDIDATELDLRTFEIKPRPPASRRTYVDSLRDNRKVILLGNAGVGKTTFQRHTVLSIFKNPNAVRYLDPNEFVVPVYIELRLLDNTRPFPIRRYLEERTVYLSGRWGRRRLKKLAHEGKLFLLLDGYDEARIAQPSYDGDTEARTSRESSPTHQMEQTSHLTSELNLLLSTPMSEIGPIEDFYKQLQGCRVWLASRRDFFLDQSPFVQGETPRTGVAILEITGVVDRQRLIEKMFVNYKLIQDHPGLFEPELFFNLINRDIGDLQRLSNNPLLLIIICSIYAHEVVRSGKPRVQIANTLDAIIERYLYLLLEGLDNTRNEDLESSPAKKELQKEVRGLYIREKRKFLEYFAAELYIENIATFTNGYTYGKAEQFFKTVFTSEFNEEILRGLRHRRGTSDFVGQINNSGILVVATGTRKKDFRYDFPHQRFRELLAAQYFDNGQLHFVTQNLHKPDLKELVYVVFRITSEKDQIIMSLLERIATEPVHTESYLRMLLACLDQNPEYTPKNAFREFFLRCLSSNIAFIIPDDLKPGMESKKYFQPDYSFKKRLVECLKCTDRLDAMKLSGDLLLIYERHSLGVTLEGLLTEPDKELTLAAFAIMAEWRYECDPSSAREYFRDLFWQYLNASNLHLLNLYSQFIRNKDYSLVRELFTSALSLAVTQSIAQKQLTTIPSSVVLLRQTNDALLNSVLREELLKRIKRNEFAIIPHWLIEVHRHEGFGPTWAEGLWEGLKKNGAHSVVLALDLGMHYEEGLRDVAQKVLLPALESGHALLLNLAANSPRINNYLHNLSKDDSNANQIVSLASVVGKVFHSDQALPLGLATNQDHCHIVTPQIIKQLQEEACRLKVKVSRRDWFKLYKLTFRFFLAEEFQKKVPDTFNETLTMSLMDLSRISYPEFELVAKAIRSDSKVGPLAATEQSLLKRKFRTRSVANAIR